MNDLYHWNLECMVKHQMQEVDRAVKEARLLKEAGLSRPSLLARGAKALRNWLKTRSEKVQDHRSLEHETY